MEYFQDAYSKLEGVETKYRELARNRIASEQMQSKYIGIAIIAQMMRDFPVKDEVGSTDLTIDKVTQRLINEGLSIGISEGSVLDKIRQVGHEIGVLIIRKHALEDKNLYIRASN